MDFENHDQIQFLGVFLARIVGSLALFLEIFVCGFALPPDILSSLVLSQLLNRGHNTAYPNVAA